MCVRCRSEAIRLKRVVTPADEPVDEESAFLAAVEEMADTDPADEA